MSTRSATIVRQKVFWGENRGGYEEVFRFYRHFNGYPTGHGLDMARAFLAADRRKLKSTTWFQHLFGALFTSGEIKESWDGQMRFYAPDLEAEAPGTEDGDIEYLYVVDGPIGEGPETTARITCWRCPVGADADYTRLQSSAPLFSGTPEEYVTWALADEPDEDKSIIEIDVDDMRSRLYAAYQLDWMIEHGHSLQEFALAIIDPSSDFYDMGFDGESWSCFDDFLKCEYRDTAYMKRLVGRMGFDDADRRSILAAIQNDASDMKRHQDA